MNAVKLLVFLKFFIVVLFFSYSSSADIMKKQMLLHKAMQT